MRTNLKVFRIKHFLTQGEIAEKIGCTRSTYSAIERGKRDGGKIFWKSFQRVFHISDEEMWALWKNEE